MCYMSAKDTAQSLQSRNSVCYRVSVTQLTGGFPGDFTASQTDSCETDSCETDSCETDSCETDSCEQTVVNRKL